MLVGAVRQAGPASLPNLGAQVAPLGAAATAALLEELRARAELVTESAPTGTAVADTARAHLDAWLHKRKVLPVGQLGYRADAKAAAGLLREPDDPPWDDWSAPLSLRDVEPEVLFQLRRDDPTWQQAPAWDFSATPTRGGRQ